MSLHELTLTELSAGLAAKRFSSREVIDALLSRIEKADGKLHAFTPQPSPSILPHNHAQKVGVGL